MSDLPLPLEFVDGDVVDSRFRVVLFGQSGAGKSVGAVTAPGPILVLTADRPGAYRFARTRHPKGHIREARVEGRRTLEQAYEHLKRGGGGEQTVVVDPVGNVYDLLLKELGGARPQIQHHGQVQTAMIDFVRALRALPVNLVLVCHEQIDDNEEAGALRQPLVGGQKLGPKVMAEMDIVAHVGRIPPSDDTPERFVGVLAPERGRVAKDSTGALGRVRDLDLAGWFEVANHALHGEPTPFDEPESKGDKERVAA